MPISTVNGEMWASPVGGSAQLRQANKLIPKSSTGSPALPPTETRDKNAKVVPRHSLPEGGICT